VLDDIATVQNYEYDQAGRLIRVTGDVNETWGYDTNGNRTHRNGSPIATFDAQDRILSQNDATYEHNLMGQRTKKVSPEGTTTYRYDNLGNLRDVVLPDGTQITYVIDPQDRRIGRKVNGNWTHKWIYQDGLNPIAEMDAENRIRKAFVYADKGHVPSHMLTFDESGNEAGQYRIVSDLLGSVRVVYDLANGNPVQRIDYDVWGNIINDANPDFQPFAFAGGLYDQKTKLTRFGARDYDAETGRWLEKDPIGFGGGLNFYRYASNDPVNRIDPEGLEDCGGGKCPKDSCKIYRCQAQLGDPDRPREGSNLAHAYSCVEINGVMTCKGLVPFSGSGRSVLFDETYNSSLCRLVSADCCYAKCLLAMWGRSAPNWYASGTCQGYDQGVNLGCSVGCSPPPPNFSFPPM
jgi:RHS repeat-associated protein